MATTMVDLKEFDEALKTTDLLVDESVQIYELDSEKKNVVDELYNSLRTVTEYLGFSVELPSKIFKNAPDAKITMTPSLDIVIKYQNGKEEQKRLDELTTDEISQILQTSLSPIIDLVKKEKIDQNKNITFIRAVTKKLDKIQKIDDSTDDVIIPDLKNDNMQSGESSQS